MRYGLRSLLVLSARNESALAQLAVDYSHYIASHPDIDLASVCHTLASGRRHFEYRLAVTAASREEMLEQLAKVDVNSAAHPTVEHNDANQKNGRRHLNGAAGTGPSSCQIPSSSVMTNRADLTPTIAWVFGDSGATDLAKGRELYVVEPTFRDLIDSLDERLADHAAARNQPSEPLRNWFAAEIEPTHSSEVYLFALQAGLAKVWESWGIEPEIVLGLGVGQYTAACVAGGLCFREAVALIVERQAIVGRVREWRQESKTNVSNSDLPADLQASLDQFESFADAINYYPPALRLICSLSGALVPVHRSLGGSYWRQHCLDLPQVAASLQTLAQQEPDWIIDCGPPGDFAAESRGNADWLRCMTDKQSVTTTMLHTLGKLYVNGALPDFKRFNSHWQHQRLSMPTYPFQKKRYWITEISDHVVQAVETVQG